jgi:uncharacterized Rmd1/YagE family protein
MFKDRGREGGGEREREEEIERESIWILRIYIYSKYKYKFYVGRSINITKAHKEFCADQPHRFKRDFIMISFPPPPPPPPPPPSSISINNDSTHNGSPLRTFDQIQSSPPSSSHVSNLLKDTKLEEIDNTKKAASHSPLNANAAAVDVFGDRKPLHPVLSSITHLPPSSTLSSASIHSPSPLSSSDQPSSTSSTPNNNTFKSNGGVLQQQNSATPHVFGNKHIVVFNYGSVVFFNFSEVEIQKKLNELKAYTTDLIPR